MATATDVAKYFIRLAAAEDPPEFLCHLRLQKLLYYAQGWSLALRGRALFESRIEAWAYGPVVRDLYSVFADYGDKPIPPGDFGDPEALDADEKEFVAAVWDAYKEHSAIGLSVMAHKEAPWQGARGHAGPADRSANEITHESMKRFFSKKPG